MNERASAIQSNNVPERVLLEKDWYIIKAGITLIKILEKPLKELEPKKNQIYFNSTFNNIGLIEDILKSLIESNKFALGIEILPERFKVSDYPSDFLKFLKEEWFSIPFIEFDESNSTTQSNKTLGLEITRAYIYLINCIKELEQMIDISKSNSKGLFSFKKKQQLNSIDAYWIDLIELKTEVDNRMKVLLETYYEGVLDLVEYKLLFIYLDSLASPNIVYPVLAEEALQDTSERLRKDINEILYKVKENDLFFLGNHVIEDLCTSFDLKLNFQDAPNFSDVTEAKQYREKLMNFSFQLYKKDLYIKLAPLIVDDHFIHALTSQKLEFKGIYQEINQAFLQLIDRYENFSLEKLTEEKILDDKSEFFLFLHNLGFRYDSRYDDISSGKTLDLNYSSTLDTEFTDNPAKHFMVSEVHQRGILHKDSCIRRNLVTVFKIE